MSGTQVKEGSTVNNIRIHLYFHTQLSACMYVISVLFLVETIVGVKL